VRILYISQYYPPEANAPAVRVSQLASRWVRAGHDVTVLTGFPNAPDGRLPRAYWAGWLRGWQREVTDGVQVVRTWLLPVPSGRGIQRMMSYGSFAMSSLVAATLLRRRDVVIATSPQLLVGLSGYWYARRKRVPFVFEVRDLWPESLSAVAASSSQSLVYRILGRLASMLYTAADHVVTVTLPMRDRLASDHHIPVERLTTIGAGVAPGSFTVPDGIKERVLEELGLAGCFTVGYVGTHGAAHGLDIVLDAAALLAKRDPNVRFVLAGAGASKSNLVATARARSLPNVVFLDPWPHALVPQLLAAMDVCLVSLRDALLFRTVLPTKLTEYMAAGRPTIANVDGETRRVLEESGAGVFVRPGDAEALADAVMFLQADPERRERMGRAAVAYAERNFDRDRQAAEYLDLLRSVVAGTNPIANGRDE